MRKLICRKVLLFYLVACFALFNPFIFAQTENDKPKVKNFGSSLKNKDNSKSKKDKKDLDTDEDIIRIETNLVVNDLLVLDKQGRSIKGLTSEDFIVWEDEKEQIIKTFSLGDSAAIPRSIVLIIDYSGSLSPFIETTVEAAKVLVDKLNAKDRMAIVTDEIKLLAEFTNDKTLLKKKLESIKNLSKSSGAKGGWFRGHSLQYSALMATLKELFDDEDIRPIIIFQTDGDEITILPPFESDTPKSVKKIRRNFSLKDVYETAERSRVTIYSIIPGKRLAGLSEDEQLRVAKKQFEESLARFKDRLSPQNKINTLKDADIKRIIQSKINMQTGVEDLAKLTGGWADYLEKPEQAEAIYSRILSGIADRYIIGYYPTNEAKDGKRRTVKIQVKNHPEYIIWGRKTYFAPSLEK